MLDKNSEFCYAYRLLPKEEFSPAKVFVLISAKSPVGSTMTQRFSCFHCAALLLRIGLAGPTAGTRGLHAGARFLGEGRSISAQSPQARVRPAVPTACTPAQELGIVFFCVLRKETKQTVGAGVSKGSHSRNLESRFFLHNKASCGSPINTRSLSYSWCRLSEPSVQESGGRGCCGYRAGQDRRQEEHVPFVLRTQEDFKR